jgi:hypothetical protein
MSMSDETQEFNVKRALWVLVISYFTFEGIISYLQLSNIINFNAGVILLFTGSFALIVISVGLQKYKKEQEERKKEIERYRKW